MSVVSLKLWRDMSIAKKIITMNSIMIILMMAVYLYIGYSLNANNTLLNKQTMTLVELDAMQQKITSLSEMRYWLTDYYINRSENSKKLFFKYQKNMLDYVGKLENSPLKNDVAVQALVVKIKKFNASNLAFFAAEQAGETQQVLSHMQEIKKLGSELNAELAEVLKIVNVQAKTIAETLINDNKNMLTLGAILMLIATILAIIFSVTLSKLINNPISSAMDIANKIANGNWDLRINVNSNDETGKLLRSLEIMREKLQDYIAEVHREAEENLRIKTALDNVETQVIVTDNERKVIYMNNAMKKFIKEINKNNKNKENKTIIDELYGKDITIIYENQPDLKQALQSSNQSVAAEVTMWDKVLYCTHNSVINDDATFLGIVVEWTDRTAIFETEKEVDHIVKAAAKGYLNNRLILENKQGFFRKFSENINELLDINEKILKDTLRVFSALSRGQLTEEISGDYEGIFLTLQQDANQTVAKLTETINKIRKSSATVSSTANELALGNADLSQRTEEQAASLANTTSSMGQLSAIVKQSAEQAKKANQMVKDARTHAEVGGEKVSQVVSAMSAIHDSSNKIADIIGVIDEIAFQTNLLALNAAVEAARAGEQGRGFSVVASEVRNLAQRSAGAAKEIKELIQDSVKKVQAGTELVSSSGQALTEIVSAVSSVSDTVGEIAASAQNQASRIDEVNNSINQIDTITHQNAALVEEAAAASEEMDRQAKDLRQMIEFFELEAQGNDEVPAPKLQTPTAKTPDEQQWEEF
ncbi:MAG: methyl-accepting chemotaxis protein [Gammaproteobacteria bacterium]